MANLFTQVVVWPHTLLGEDNTEQDFKQFITETFDVRVKLIGEHRINNDRTDLLFYIHSEDITKFAVPRLSWSMRWLEDVMANDGSYRPPEGIRPTWNEDAINEAQNKPQNS
jgi:hypothetical protein